MLTRFDQHVQCPCKEGRKSSERGERKQQKEATKEAGDFHPAQGLKSVGFQLVLALR